MHNLTKIKLYRIALKITYVPSLIFVFPFALLKKKNKGSLFFFLDRYALGGAQHAYLDILKSVAHVDKQIYFTRYSPNKLMRSDFYSITRSDTRDIHFYCDYLLIRLFSVHFYSFYLNRHKDCKLLGSNSTFFFDMLPFLNRRLSTIEVFHNFSFNRQGMEFFGLANHQYLSHRICGDFITADNIRKQYSEYGVSKNFEERVQVIEPGVTIPEPIEKDFTLPLRVLYAGRGGPQKRVWILNTVVEKTVKNQLPINYYFAGTMVEELSAFTKEHSTLMGPISTQELYALYQQTHILILTSAYEGFPMAIKEAMACGSVPLVTALDGNKKHLTDHENAILIHEISDEQKCAEEAVQHLQQLIEDPALVRDLSKRAYEYAKSHFSRDQFMASYRNLLLGDWSENQHVN